ncbi:MAG: hypothetical protein ACXWHB_02665 [Usitatibacter sp.]
MKYILMIAIAVLATSAFETQGKGIEGLPIKLGDSVEKVRAALGTTMKAESSRATPDSETKELRLKSKGIWVFFDREGLAYSIRLEPPFAGNVGGVKVGSPRALLVEKLGEPAQVSKGPTMMKSRPYLYYADDVTTVRFDFDQDDKVSVIYILK